jgi:hypothetical protein
MSAAETARFNEQGGFIELVSEAASIKADPQVTGSAEQPAVPSAQTVSDAKSVAAFSRRHISPESGRALEILGHAIEYLADEFALETGISSPANDQQEQALQILMAANRNVYFDCPTVPTLWERFGNLWRVPRLLPHR